MQKAIPICPVSFHFIFFVLDTFFCGELPAQPTVELTGRVVFWRRGATTDLRRRQVMGIIWYCTLRRERSSPRRYYQLNLIPLKRLGTIEFRGFPAPPLPATQTALNWGVFSGCFRGGQPNFEPLHFGQSALGSWP